MAMFRAGRSGFLTRWRPLFAGGLIGGLVLLPLAAGLSGWTGYAGWLALVGLAILSLWPARPRRPRPAARAVGETPPPDDLVARLPDPIVLVDRRAVVVSANAAAIRILPALARRNPLSFALRAPEVLEGVARVLGGTEGADVVYGGRGANDPVYEVRVRPLAARDAAAPATAGPAAALVFRDLTPQHRLESMRVDFVANVSHELRTPLASLIGFIETLQGPARDDSLARAQFLGVMLDQARRMSRLVDDLLQLSRVELHAHQAPETPLDLGPVIDHMVGVMGPLARERGVELVFAPPAAPAVIRGDRDEMVRVAENLIENAIRYGGDGGRVEIALDRIAPEGAAAQIELTVRDHGPGIAPEHLPRLTERFYRVDPGESRSQGGTGLGLAIVKHIVARHRGRLAIESRPGAGALVRVTLPEAGRADGVTQVS